MDKYSYRVASRARECDNYAYFAILARNFELAAKEIAQSAELRRIFVSSMRISVLPRNIWIVKIIAYFRSFPPISADLFL